MQITGAGRSTKLMDIYDWARNAVAQLSAIVARTDERAI